jgi:hypothetical protein
MPAGVKITFPLPDPAVADSRWCDRFRIEGGGAFVVSICRSMPKAVAEGRGMTQRDYDVKAGFIRRVVSPTEMWFFVLSK